MVGDKWGSTAMLCLIGNEFMVHFLLLNITVHSSLWPSEAVWLSLAHQLCCVSSRPYTDCGQLIKEASHPPELPCVSITAGVSLTSPLYIPLFPDLFPIFLLSLGPIIGPSPVWKLSPSTSFPLSSFYVPAFVVLVWGYTLHFFRELYAMCGCSKAYLTRPSHEMD